ncbi:MAG: Lrp/AsnC ligand binding domain-containing protein [Saprospiraceae bacterium]
MENLDKLDYKILEILMKNAELSYKEISSQLFVSPGTVHVRVKKMKEMGVIKGTQIMVDYDKLGFDIAAFLGIYLDKSSLYDDVATQLTNIPEVVGVHYTTGLYNIFAKIICRDTTHLREVLHDKIQNIAGIQRTETFISLQESIDRPIQILDHLP